MPFFYNCVMIFFLQYCIRAAAGIAGLWEVAPRLRDVTVDEMETFYDAVCYKL